MTRYTVTWNEDAAAELAAIWLVSSSRATVTTATTEIDLQLRHDASTKGEAFGEHRLLLVDNLLAIFSVTEEDRLVRVLQVWEISIAD